jgi:glycosidase
LTLAALLALVLAAPSVAYGVLANAWHVPDNTSDLGFAMRNPEFEIGTNTVVTVYQGVQKYNNSYGTANQTGGLLYYRGASQSAWGSVALNWYANGLPNANNQHWKASFSTAGFGSNEVIQYYFYVTFDSGAANTYVYGGDGSCGVTAAQATAAAAPFSIRNRPAWIYHNNNRVVGVGADSGHNNIGIWVKSGYIGKDGSLGSRWADHFALYYTLDGSSPSGALGAGAGTTQVQPLGLDHLENDASSAGNAMWWAGTVSNVALYSTLKYKIGGWNSANSEEKFADYNAASNNAVFSYALGTLGDPVLTVNGVNADYTTTHVFVDEVAGDAIPLTILFSPNVSGALDAVELYSNLNRRDRAALDANGDGIEDGIMPPDGNALVAGDDSNYYKAYTMSPGGQPGQYALTLNAQKTGAYRLTGRYRIAGTTNWVWYSSGGRRDHAIVVSPKKARDIQLYELNVLNMGAQGTLQSQRGTFADLYGGPGARPVDGVTNRFSLAYATNLGVNWLWFQPIHPIGVDGRGTDPATGTAYEVGSPYSVKNFFQVNPLMSKANTREAAMGEFTNFVAAADAAGVNVMLDAAFNHTSWDCELDASGVNYFAPGAQTTDEIRNAEARFYSRSGAYDMRASSAAGVAAAPDRYDFGKWTDVHDVFFGRYAALVPNSSASGNYLSESDWFDYSVGSESASGDGNGHFDAITRNAWRYFADYALYWLDRTGCVAGTPAAQTARGLDGLRADFGQGLPPQCWEYIINKVRSRKWDFVFMTESLDGGAVTYRSNRHFDVLNESIIFSLKSAASATDYRSVFEGRRASYGQSLVLLNTTSHDEESYSDPYQALVRYSVCATMDGAPMVFYGQELGISTTFGFDAYEVNFGKNIPHFKKFNSLQPIFAPANRNYGLDQLWPVYAAINQARRASPALRGSNRYFLNLLNTGAAHATIFSAAKYERACASPNASDVVLAFANLDRNQTEQGAFNLNISQNGSNLFGIKSGRSYNVKNLAAYGGIDGSRRTQWLYSTPVSGDSLLNSGVFVSLNPVPGSDSAWATAPFEAQYLKLYDVTAPATPAAPGAAKGYALGNVATFTWLAANEPDGGVSGYHVRVGTAPGGSNVLDAVVAGASIAVTNLVGATLYVSVSVVSGAGIEGGTSSSSSGVVLLDPQGDYDGDGMSNAAENAAGTDPLSGGSNLKILGLSAGNQLSWSSVSNKTYQVFATMDLATNFVPISQVLTAVGPTMLYLDAPATNARQFYRVKLVP